MKLLILTQVIDINDDLLGFMHGWIKALAEKYEKLTVVCLKKGKYSLPDNVKVFSLGKENGHSIIKYIFRFYKYIWQERKEYDKVFVHMNREYVLLGGLFWKLYNKRIVFWYNHIKGNILSKISGLLANTIFFTSPFSYFSKWKKAFQMPVGIDTEIFKKDENIKKTSNSLLCLGRISPVKNVDILIKAAILLDQQGVDFKLNIIGEPGEVDQQYYEKIKELSAELAKKNKVNFLGKVKNYQTPHYYNQNEIYINMTNSGSLDKTTLEAMACGTLVLVSNQSFKTIFPKKWHDLMIWQENDEEDLAKKIIKLINLDKDRINIICKESRELILKNHSLSSLIFQFSFKDL